MFDFTDPGFLGFMESEGMMDTNEGLISRVAKVLENSPNDVIDTDEFRSACISVGVDPDSFTESDLQRLQEKLKYLKERGVFEEISGILAGKPMDEAYDSEYKQALIDVIGDPELPVVCNVNIGHAKPRCIIPFGVEAKVDAERQIIQFA